MAIRYLDPKTAPVEKAAVASHRTWFRNKEKTSPTTPAGTFDLKAYQRELMLKRRAEAKAKAEAKA